MKKLNRSFYKNSVSIFLFCAILLCACNDGLEEINENPNQAVGDPSIDLLFGAILPGFIRQVTGSFRTPGQLAQQFANKNSEVGILGHDEDGTSRRFWEIVYSENGGALRNAGFLIYQSEQQGNDVYRAIGLIYKAYMLSYASDLFGDIPYNNAGKGFLLEDQFLFPAYDPQKEVYEAMIADLSTANQLLISAPSNQLIDDDRDLLFGGNRLSWRKFANSLKLRLLMRMSNVEDVGSRITGIFNSSDTPVFESINDEPSFSYIADNDWPFDAINDLNSEIRLSATIVDILKGEGGVNKITDVLDPRLPIFVDPTAQSVVNGTPEFVGQPVGIASDIAGNDERSLLSDYMRSLNTFWLLTYADVLFIKAEAAQRGLISGDAAQFYEDAVTASMSRYGVDPGATSSQDYLASIAADFAGNELKHIAIQRWIDNLMNGFEGYAIWRRTGFPSLPIGPDVVESQIPTRYFYSSKTTDKNQTNADAAINRAPLNGQNTTVNIVWWDQ